MKTADWQDELKKEIAAKTLLDFGSSDWKVLTSFIESLLKKQTDLIEAIRKDWIGKVYACDYILMQLNSPEEGSE